jgi:hypothetical protein
MLLTSIATLDSLLQAHADALGNDFAAYRNHTYRVVNLCVAQWAGEPPAIQLEKVAIAAAFHDLGIWTDGTFDYVPPSIRLATAYLARAGNADWTTEITAMIREHHKVLACRHDPTGLVEPFRRADWIDVTYGLRRFGLPRATLREIFATWPDAGFHRRLLQFELARLRTHPWSPLPMVHL